MAFRTAIFYDIENLLKGYSFSQQLIMNLSLGEILKLAKDSHELEGLAVQKAYANWSDPRLAVMRGEINELGIDPIQVFGFSREQKKNAADIQLAIDAIDLAYSRPTIDIFVIVSGDGGFAALAKKLHEYGKTVIGCAYRSTTNNVFRSVCDGFVWINDPEQDIEYDQCNSLTPRTHQHKSGVISQVTDPRNVRLARKIELVPNFNVEQALSKTKEIIAWYASDSICKADMNYSGIFLSVVQEAVKYAIPGFQQSKVGFPKFVEYMQHACAGTEFCICRPPGAGAVLTVRKNKQNWEELPDICARETHSLENYRSILATGVPAFRLTDEHVLIAVAYWLSHNGRAKDSFGGLIEKISTALPDIAADSIKLATLSFASADVFVREPELVSISEQSLRLRQELNDYKLILEQLKIGLRDKLRQSIGDFQQDILDKLLSLSINNLETYILTNIESPA